MQIETDKMAATCVRLKMKYLGGIRISRLVVALVFLLTFYATYRFIKGQKRGIVTIVHTPHEHPMQQHDIDAYLFDIADTRPYSCRVDYSGSFTENRPTVSILVDFHNAQFYNLKLTLESIIKHTPHALYKEIILLDDGSDDQAIQAHAVEFLKHEKYTKVKAYRSDDNHGPSFTRFKASLLAEGSMLVFISSDVVVNVGWLEPLVLAIQEDDTRIVIPHADNFLSEHRFYHVDDNFVSTFSWPLSTVYMETKEENDRYYISPIMRGDVVAVDKKFLESIGGYDKDLGKGGGHDFELSLRAWLCGGQVVKSLCSRIAIHEAMKRPVVTDQTNFRRIAELWLGDHKELAYKQGRISNQLNAEERLNIKIRKSLIEKTASCKTIDWYLENVATNVQIPAENAIHYGKLKVSHAYCPRVTKEMDVSLDLCMSFMHDPDMIVTYDSDQILRMSKNQCIMATSASSRVVLTECNPDNALLKWDYTEVGQLVSQAFPDTCLANYVEHTKDRKINREMRTEKCRAVDDEMMKQTWIFISF